MTSRTVFELDKESRERYGRILHSRKLAFIPAEGLQKVWDIVSRIACTLKGTYNAKNVWVFGSLAKGAFSPSSDIDIAVEGVPAAFFYRACADLLNCAEGRDVDLVDIDDCLAEMRAAILREGKLVA